VAAADGTADVAATAGAGDGCLPAPAIIPMAPMAMKTAEVPPMMVSTLWRAVQDLRGPRLSGGP
jgi:hypothetical protein